MWIGLRHGELSRVIQTMHGSRSLQRGARLADSLWTLQGNRRQAADELVEFGVEDPTLVRAQDRHAALNVPKRHVESGNFGSANLTASASWNKHLRQTDSCASDQNPGKEKGPVSGTFNRALCRTRTGDPFLTMEVLYQLS